MAPPSQDPFYLVRQDIQDFVNELQQKMSRFHGLTASNPERKKVAAEVEHGVDSLRWQLNELDGSCDKAAADFARFKLTSDEINSRRKWIASTRRQIEGMSETLKTATAAPAMSVHESKMIASNDKFVRSEYEQQQLVVKEQDQHLEDIEQAVTRLGRVGLDIHKELEHQGQLLDELDEDIDTTHSRLKAAQKKMLDVLKKSGSTTQLAVIGFLIVVLIILVVFAFY